MNCGENTPRSMIAFLQEIEHISARSRVGASRNWTALRRTRFDEG